MTQGCCVPGLSPRLAHDLPLAVLPLMPCREGGHTRVGPQGHSHPPAELGPLGLGSAPRNVSGTRARLPLCRAGSGCGRRLLPLPRAPCPSPHQELPSPLQSSLPVWPPPAHAGYTATSLRLLWVPVKPRAWAGQGATTTYLSPQLTPDLTSLLSLLPSSRELSR